MKRSTTIDRPTPRKYERRGQSFQRRRFDASVQNLDNFRETRRVLPDGQSRRLAEYFIDVVAESAEPNVWLKMLDEAHRRVALYFPPN